MKYLRTTFLSTFLLTSGAAFAQTPIGTPTDPAWNGAATSASLISIQKAIYGIMGTILGMPSDAAWSGSGNGTLIAIQKAMYNLINSPVPVCSGSPACTGAIGGFNLMDAGGTNVADSTNHAVKIETYDGALPAKDASVGTTNTNIGAPGSTACATDTGSCSGNQLLQRIAQRLTSILTGPVPVSQSGTWTVQPGNTANTTAWNVDGSAVTQPVSAASLPLPSGAATSANQTATQAATGAAPPANANQPGVVVSGATGGLLAPIRGCDQSATYDASTSGSTRIITGVSGRKVYICGYIISVGGTATNVKLIQGTGTNCGTGSDPALTPAYQLAANGNIGEMAAFWNGTATATNANDVCVNTSAGNAVQVKINFSIQ